MTSTCEGRTFDWVSHHDPRSRAYPIRAIIGERVGRRRRLWRPGRTLDQGREGACVGHAWVGEAVASPVRVDLARAEMPGLENGQPWPRDPQALAFAVYREAQRRDEWPGEAYSGTSVLAGAKVMAGLRFMPEYRWAFGADDVADTIANYGPVVLGIPWHESMYEASGGEVRVRGSKVGGHAILANAYDSAREVNGMPAREMIGLFNSWGPEWGICGQGWITLEDLAVLLDDGGEAAVPVRRSYGRTEPRRSLFDIVRGWFGHASGGRVAVSG